MLKTSTTDVWEFRRFSEEESAEVRLHVMIYEKSMQELKSSGATPRGLEKVLDEQQPRISNFLNEKLEKFSSDKLFQCVEEIAAKKRFIIQETGR